MGEFVALMALMTSLVALSIDAMLPALGQIGTDLEVQRPNDTQLVVSSLFLGLALGTIVYGPLSDSFGRKPAVYAGFALFLLGCVVSITANSFEIMLAGRVLQGFGVAGPRVVTIAIVRDQHAGRAMARVMSFVMAVFILVPAVAPAIGQGILLVATWRAIFAAFVALALVALVWFAIRQPETLPSSRRIPFSLARIARALREILATRRAVGYTVAAGLIFGAFLGYLNSAQAVFQNQYGLGSKFPLYFAALALAIGSASYFNARLVMRYGMRPLTNAALWSLSALSALFWLIAYFQGGHPPLWSLMGYFALGFFCVGVLFGNVNALAMEPLGHVAGAGAAVVASLSVLISLPLGILIGHSHQGTILPLVGGFAMLGAATLIVTRWTEGKTPFGESPSTPTE